MLSCFIKGAPRSASKLSIDPINSHASYIGKSTGSNKRSVPINRPVSSNWNQRVCKFNHTCKLANTCELLLEMFNLLKSPFIIDQINAGSIVVLFACIFLHQLYGVSV